jgi:DNA-binding MarR family transcriptional regulator
MALKAIAPGPPKVPPPNSRQQEAVASILRTANYLRRSGMPVFESYGITSQQYNVLRILRGAGPQGLPTLDIAGRMIEQAPGITRLLDRLEAKQLVCRERPPGNRRQVLCQITKAGRDVVQDLDAPLKEMALKSLRKLGKPDLDELIRLLALARNEAKSQ